MKLKDIKKILDKLTPEQLEQELKYNSDENGISGRVASFKKARALNNERSIKSRLLCNALFMLFHQHFS